MKIVDVLIYYYFINIRLISNYYWNYYYLDISKQSFFYNFIVALIHHVRPGSYLKVDFDSSDL